MYDGGEGNSCACITTLILPCEVTFLMDPLSFSVELAVLWVLVGLTAYQL